MPPGGPKRVSPSKPSVIEIYGKCDPVKPLKRKIGGKPNYIGYMKICRLKLPKKDCLSIDLCKYISCKFIQFNPTIVTVTSQDEFYMQEGINPFLYMVWLI